MTPNSSITACVSGPRRALTARILRAGALASALVLAGQVSGLVSRPFASDQRSPDAFVLFAGGNAATLLVDSNDWPGVIRVATDLRTDISRVSGITPHLVNKVEEAGQNPVIIGTIGRSALIDRLAGAGKLDVSGIAGKWEASLVQTVKDPFPGVALALVIAGSDRRGTIFGVYTLSEQIGVSPWHWWADVPPWRHTEMYVRAGRHQIGPPGVKYRGIFINNEAPGLMMWARSRYGELNHRMYTNVFELILRLRGNFLWPAMWDNSFATDDPLNPKLADKYGVVISTSHHEPMMRAWKEWRAAGNPPNSWDYTKNDAKLREFWAEGLRRTRDYEKVITLGMRGDGDEPMSETENVALLERIVAGQRRMIGEIIHPDVERVPQVWALYKEVQGYYERGMRVPDDVILLWCNDNWGNIRRVPSAEARRRAGGSGIYFHFDYVGGPRNYKWVNTVPLPKIWEQMNLAWNYGMDRIWLVNVGDIKPMEAPIEFFLTMAWNPDAVTQHDLDDYLQRWAAREFGEEHAAAAAEIVARYTKYNARRKPELLEPGTFSIENYGEAARVLADWQAIAARAQAIHAQLPQERRDAFYQLVVHPAVTCAVLNELYIAVAKNRFYARHGDGRANAHAQRARELFRRHGELRDHFHTRIAGGKWRHMMNQTVIGYTYWQQPPADVMPEVVEVTNAVAAVDRLARPAAARIAPQFSLPSSWTGFVEGDGHVAMEAEHFTRNVPANSARWEVLPDHGRTLSAVTVFPVTAPSVTPPENSPRLEYRMWFTNSGPVQVELILSPSLNICAYRPVRIAVSFNDEEPVVLTVVPQGYTAGDGNADWEESVRNAVRKVRSRHTIAAPGSHTLKVWMVDPAVVLQRIVVDTGGVKPSYLGPPESYRAGSGAGWRSTWDSN